jgi:hypothetical protein
MSIEFQIKARDKYTEFTCQGEFSYKGMLDLINKALNLAKKEKSMGVLLDIRNLEGSSLTTMERFDLGSVGANMQLSQKSVIPIAVVGRDKLIDPRKFAEIVAKNRGANVIVTTDFDEAVSWFER